MSCQVTAGEFLFSSVISQAQLSTFEARLQLLIRVHRDDEVDLRDLPKTTAVYVCTYIYIHDANS